MKTFSLGVIGDPIGHTLSPFLHEQIAAALGVSCSYRAYHVKPEELARFVQDTRHSLDGFNVTIPHKEAILPLLDEIAPYAAACGAVNTVCIRDGRLTGYNTDGDGFAASLLQDCGFSANGKHILMLGGGGAAKAIHKKLSDLGAKTITLAVRTPARASGFSTLPHTSVVPLDTPLFKETARQADLIVNTTPLGMQGYGQDFADCSFLDGTHAVVYDLVYRPMKTTLLCEAQQRGLVCAGGIGMLIHQALSAFSHFTGLQFAHSDLASSLKTAVLQKIC